MTIAVGTITAFDPDTGGGAILSRDGKLVRFDHNCRISADDLGRKVAYRFSGAGDRVWEIHTGPAPHPGWPPVGEIARVICVVQWYGPGDPHRFLRLRDVPDSVAFLRKKRSVRRDLRPGDHVIAEVITWRGDLIALRAVRLPKGYETAQPPSASQEKGTACAC